MNTEKEIKDLWERMEKLAAIVAMTQDGILTMLKEFKIVQEAVLSLQTNLVAVNKIILQVN